MPARNQDLHGNVPDKADVALLLIDVINDLEFKEGRALLKRALPVAEKIAQLKKRAKRAGLPVVYVNDNFGKWRSDFKKLVSHCLNDDVCGRPLVERLKPEEDDYFILKPKNSAFYATTLSVLLDYLHVKTLILTGFTGDNCVLFTAHDAYLRDFYLTIPSDCVASYSEKENRQALRMMKRLLKAEVCPSNQIRFRRPSVIEASQRRKSA
ncbi:MAG: cysteine hydrolase [Nitrospirae bacterium]|nr:cysteine hydrolase [Candidatus Manganitrophaceae bacterium]